MKIRIKTYNGELPSYLTVGKVYEAGYHDDEIFQIIDDDGYLMESDFLGCSYLNGGSWEISNEYI